MEILLRDKHRLCSEQIVAFSTLVRRTGRAFCTKQIRNPFSHFQRPLIIHALDSCF
jgi:hypothetical protein